MEMIGFFYLEILGIIDGGTEAGIIGDEIVGSGEYVFWKIGVGLCMEICILEFEELTVWS